MDYIIFYFNTNLDYNLKSFFIIIGLHQGYYSELKLLQTFLL